jgi:hypothetical protein
VSHQHQRGADFTIRLEQQIDTAAAVFHQFSRFVAEHTGSIVTSARATAARCRSPPEFARLVTKSIFDPLSSRLRRRTGLGGSVARIISIIPFSSAVNSRSRWWN